MQQEFPQVSKDVYIYISPVPGNYLYKRNAVVIDVGKREEEEKKGGTFLLNLLLQLIMYSTGNWTSDM